MANRRRSTSPVGLERRFLSVAGQTNMSSPKAKKSLNPFDDDDDDDNVDVRDTFGMDKHKGSKYEPVPKFGHHTAIVGEKLYLWGGWQKDFPEVHSSDEKTDLTSTVDVLNLHKGEWEKVEIFGQPPLGVRGYVCTAVGSNIYYFGGYCGHDWCRHYSLKYEKKLPLKYSFLLYKINNLLGKTSFNANLLCLSSNVSFSCLDTATLQWKEVHVANPPKSPMRKNACGMVAFSQGEEDFLFVFGGTGMLCSANQPEAIYIPWKENPDYGWTNESHIFSLKTGEWIIPSSVGDRRPPVCAGHTFTKITHNSAVLYGGFDPYSGQCLSNVYIVEMSKTSMHWHKLPLQSEQPEPHPRHDHASVCISGPLFNQIKPLLLISGGRDIQWQSLGDIWLLDCSSGNWQQLEVPQAVGNRHFHSLSVFAVNKSCVYGVMYGGVKEWLPSEPASEQPIMSDTTILEISCDDDDTWRVSAVLDSNMLMSTEEYKCRLIQRLFLILKTTQRENPANFDLQKVGQLQNQLKEKEIQLKEAEEKADTLAHQLQKVKELSQQPPKAIISQPMTSPELDNAQLRAMKAEQLAIETTGDALRSFLIQRDEIQMTGPDIAKGSYGHITLAQYKGFHVSAKILNGEFMNDYNKLIMHREMLKSMQIRHPNLIQLFGASIMGRNVVLISEVMPVSLRFELEKKSLSKQEILNISCDVASTLSYLHEKLMYPVTHRGVCSSNVFLEPLQLRWRAKLSDFFTSNFFYFAINAPSILDPAYLAPDVLSLPHELSPKLDIFSFGVTLMEMVSQTLPSANPVEREKQLTGIKWPLIVNVIRKCIASDSSERPSASQILSDLCEVN